MASLATRARLVCEYLREYNIPFIAAGRDAAKVKAVVEKIPGIETADYESCRG